MEKRRVRLKTVVERLKLEVVYRAPNFDRVEIDTMVINRCGLQLTGFYDYFTAGSFQLPGRKENTYLKGIPSDEVRYRMEELMSKGIPAIVLCHMVDAMPECLEAAEKIGVTLLKTDEDTSVFLARLLNVLTEYLAPRITRHGVLVEVYGEGIMLLGESGVGKSETAIELIKRGHRLIADDAVEIRHAMGNTLIGSAPELIRHYMELRGIGVIDVRRLFGMGAIKSETEIDLVINIEQWKDGMMYDRLGTENQYISVLDVHVPAITIPVKPGRNLAIIIEVAAMNNRQKKMGHNAALEFTEQINKHFDSSISD